MPPPGHELLLKAIRAEPEDDTLRLAYADWLDENGDAARAEFVRVQCRLATLGHGPLWPGVRTLDADVLTRGLRPEVAVLVLRQAELWEANRRNWQAEFPEIPGSTVLFHRGFASVVVVEHPGGLMRYGEELFGATPVTRVVLRECRPEVVETPVSQPWFAAVRGLTVSWADATDHEGNRAATALAEADYLTGLRDLSLFNTRMTNAGAQALAGAPFVRQLARLDLARNRIRDAGALSLASALDPRRLVVLDLGGNPLTDAARDALRATFGDRAYLEPARV